MRPQDGEVYIISDTGDDVWASPTPVSTAIVDAVIARTELEADDLESVDTYVDAAELEDVLSGDEGDVSFQVEGHEVVVGANGDIDVSDTGRRKP